MRQEKRFSADEPRVRSQLGVYLNDLGLNRFGIEIGVYRGRFAEKILERWQGEQLWLVDPWRHLDDYLDSYNRSDARSERNLAAARRRLSRWAARVEWLRERSEEAAACFPGEFFDFIYIDANHSYQHVSRDLRLWFPKLRVGGLFAGHDYYNAIADARLEPILVERAPADMLTSYGVKSAVDEFAVGIGASVKATRERFPSWYFVKASAGS